VGATLEGERESLRGVGDAYARRRWDGGNIGTGAGGALMLVLVGSTLGICGVVGGFEGKAASPVGGIVRRVMNVCAGMMCSVGGAIVFCVTGCN
jgi:hypothetical protein